MKIINAKIYTMDKPGIIGNGFIEFNGKHIANIGSMDDFGSDIIKSQSDSPDIIDASGCSIFPGFIDAHTHIGLFEDGSGEAGCDGNEDTDPNTANLLASDGVNPFDNCFHEAALGGVTSVVTAPGSANIIAGFAAAVKTGGPANHRFTYDDIIIKDKIAMKMALGENPKFTYSDKNTSPVTRMASAAILREALEKAIEYGKALEKYKQAPDDNDVPEYDAKCEALAGVISGEIPIHIHAHRADDICTALRIKKQYNLNMTIVHATEAHLISEVIANSGVGVLVGPSFTDRGKEEMKNLSIKTAAEMIKAGVLCAIITDHPETPVQYLPVCAGLAIRGGADYYEAIRAITINPAKICGLDKKIGSLCIGKDADLSIFRDDPTDIKSTPVAVFINGEKII